jgi:geranylgeranyl diphosphate synthase type I
LNLRPPETLEGRLFEQIEQAWKAAGAWPDFTAAMRQSLLPQSGAAPASGASRPPWLRLPLLCCQAAGSDPRLAEPAAAAWVLLYAAAHLLDSIQDGDPPEAWWEPLGSGPASNVATGLIATCSLLLTSGLEPRTSTGLLVQDFFQTVLQMSSAQHSDLTVSSPSLEDSWRMAEAKSGAFFGLACRAGARAAGIDEALVSHYSTYGVSLGLLVQIGDDLGDLAAVERGQHGHGQLALPVAYLRSVGSPAAQRALRRGLQGSGSGLGPEPVVTDLLAESGAGLYLHAKVHQFRQRGAAALRQGAQPSAALEELLELLESSPSSA